MREKNMLVLLKSILDAVPYEITLKDLDGTYIYANENFYQNINYVCDEVYGKDMSEFWGKDDYEEIRKLDLEAVEKNKGIFSERKLRTITNNERWYYLYKAPINIGNDKYVITVSQEITINKKIINLMTYKLERDSQDVLGYYDVLYDKENKIESSDREYKRRITTLCKDLCKQLEAVNIDIYLYDEEKNELNLYISTCDKRSDDFGKAKIKFEDKKFFEFTKAELTIDYDMLYMFNSDDMHEVRIHEIKYGNNVIGIMNIYYDKKYDIHFELNDIITSTCYKFGLIFQNKIISRKCKEEEKRKIEYKQALDAENFKTSFFSMVSHEIRTPLNIIISSMQLMENELEDCSCCKYNNKITRNISYIKQNSNRILRLVNNIRDVNKISSVCANVNYVNCNIVEFIEDISLSVADYTKTSTRNIIFDTEEEEIITACDLDKVERIMLNLLSNAIKYSNENTDILVKIKLNEDKNKIIISVWDDGIPIDPKDSERIFNKFVQLDDSFKRPCEGNGIGLFLVKSLVEIQGGNVWVNNEIKKGTEIIFTLPVRIVEGKKQIDIKKDNLKSNKVEVYNVEFSDIYS